MGNWEVKLDSQKETLIFNDTRRETGKDVLRPIFLQYLAKDGEIVRREMRVTDPEGRTRYSDTFLIIDLKDELGKITLLFEHHINLGIRMVGVIDSARKAQKILKHLEEIVKINNKKEIKITLPPTYRLSKGLETPLKNG
ncbi:MAG: hypothetical protein QW279_00820 [Candidatus Jordarchaeaceae archaeon]